MVMASLASSAGARVGASTMFVVSSIRSVTIAAAARQASESCVGNATRSIVASEAKPSCSARAAHSTTERAGVPGIGFGSPMPMRIGRYSTGISLKRREMSTPRRDWTARATK